MRARSLALLLFAGLCTTATAQPQAHLLGLSFEAAPEPPGAFVEDTLARQAFQTFLLRTQTDSIAFLGTRPHLWIPTGERYVEVGTRRSYYNAWTEDFVWSAPAGMPGTYPGITAYNGEHCEGRRTYEIHYAGPAYVGLERRSFGYCEGAPHPWLFQNLAVVPLDSTTHLGLAIDSVLGEPGRLALDAAAERFLAPLPPEDAEQFVPYLDPASWVLRHRRGRWLLEGRLDPSDVSSTRFADLELALAPPAALVGTAPSDLSWATVARTDSTVTDFVVLGRDWVVLVRPGQLSVHPLDPSGAIGPARAYRPIPRRARVVMTRSGTAAEAERWRSHFSPPLPPSGSS